MEIQVVNRIVNDHRRVRNWRAWILGITRVVGEMKLLQKMEIAGDE